MHYIKRSIEYARQAISVFVKPLAQQSALAALGNKWHSRFALHPRSTTIRLRIKQGMAARAGRHCARARLAPRERMTRSQHELVRQCLSVHDTSSYEFVTCISSRRNSLHNHLTLDA